MKNENTILNKSDFDLTNHKKISIEEYKERIISLVTPILLHRFPDQYGKQKPRTYRDRVSIACPYCGDSAQSSHKKRGNFILEGKHSNFYKCFNCDTFKRTDQFFKDYNVQLELDVIDYIVDHQGNFQSSSGSNSKYDASLLLDVDTIESYAFDREELKKSLGLVEVKGQNVEKWLRRRLQFKNENFLYSPNKDYLAILNLTQTGKIIGLQKRELGRLRPGQEKYLTYKLSKLYKGLKPDIEVPDDIDSLSTIFGILLLNYNMPITLFEGPFDSFLFKNSIAVSGANKTMPFDISVKYWFDYDKTGLKKSIQYIQEEKSVFLWDKFIKTFSLPYRNKWDWNDALIYFKEKKINIPFMDDYFSKNPMDLIDI